MRITWFRAYFKANMLYFFGWNFQGPRLHHHPITMQSFKNRQTLEQFFEPLYLKEMKIKEMKNSSATSQWTTAQSKGRFPLIIGRQSLLSAQIPIAILHMSQHFKMIRLFLSILIHATTLNFRVERNVVLPFWNHDTRMGIQYTFWSSPSLPSASKTGWVVCCRVLGLKRRWITPGYHRQQLDTFQGNEGHFWWRNLTKLQRLRWPAF